MILVFVVPVIISCVYIYCGVKTQNISRKVTQFQKAAGILLLESVIGCLVLFDVNSMGLLERTFAISALILLSVSACYFIFHFIPMAISVKYNNFIKERLLEKLTYFSDEIREKKHDVVINNWDDFRLCEEIMTRNINDSVFFRTDKYGNFCDVSPFFSGDIIYGEFTESLLKDCWRFFFEHKYYKEIISKSIGQEVVSLWKEKLIK